MVHIHNPYGDLSGGAWLRGNLHAHTNRTDGTLCIQTVIDSYSKLGYDFLAITDHDMLTGPGEYDWLDPHEMVLLPGNEITANGSHILHVGGNTCIPPTPERQAALDAVGRDAGFAVVNHPNWEAHYNHCPLELLQSWRGYAGLEIFNNVIGRLDGTAYATDKWDRVLSTGRTVWGFANDDSHKIEDLGGGWNMVYATNRTPLGILTALQSGRFYASTGVVIDNIAVTGDIITITAPNARRIVASGRNGHRIAVSDGRTIEVEPNADCGYVRFECWGDGESFAWTQPFFVD
ncbi:MAG TPA: CehA/McbA family metallohydrolase [Capsulimonadaceae bacterium]|jgi:hypothetical protein